MAESTSQWVWIIASSGDLIFLGGTEFDIYMLQFIDEAKAMPMVTICGMGRI